MGKLTINGPFSIAMLVDQRVYLMDLNGLVVEPRPEPRPEGPFLC